MARQIHQKIPAEFGEPVAVEVDVDGVNIMPLIGDL